MKQRRTVDGQRGLTLIELMIGMVLSSILMAFILGSAANMTIAFKNQDKLAGQTLSLRGGRDYLAREARMAGRYVSRFRVGTGVVSSATDLLPVQVVNGANGAPDILRVYYADSAWQHPLASFNGASAVLPAGADSGNIPQNSLVVLVAPHFVPGPTPGLLVSEYEACVLKATMTGGSTVAFASSGTPYNSTNNPQCDNVRNQGTPMFLAPFVARAFKINTTDSTLEMSPNGELEPGQPNWQVLALDFVNLQIASRYFELGNTVNSDNDVDNDSEHDWYSSANQAVPDPNNVRPADARLTMLSIGIATRQETSSVASAQTPAFIRPSDDADPLKFANNNEFGDYVPVSVTTPHVYRSTRVLVDLRNLAMGI